jgi:pimeloyl-ACP methyl ester carboxylesterase
MRHRRRTAAAALVTALVASAAAACLPGGNDHPDRATAARARLNARSCPAEVDAQIVARHDCLTLVVTSRSAAGPAKGPRSEPVRVFVVRVDPPGAARREPIVIVGTDYATGTDYVGTAPVAQRTGRVLYLLDQRGTGHSTPSLACPEVDGLGPVAAAASTADPDMQARVAAAVGACRARLEQQGVDPEQFTAARAADDLHLLAQALHVRRWVVDAHGTASLVALDYARAHLSQVAALVLDSPELPEHGPDGQGTGLDTALAAVAAACADQGACSRAYGDLPASWRRALTQLDATPLRIATDRATVPVDAAALRRMVLLALGDPQLGPGAVPALVTEAVQHRTGPTLRELVERLANGPPYCAGFQPKCRPAQPIALGAVLAERCGLPDLTLPVAAPWAQSCRTWSSERTRPGPTVALNVPALVLFGRFDPFADPTSVRAQLPAVLPDATVVEDPAGGHNVLAGDCLRTVRNAWNATLDGASPVLRSPNCLASRRVQFRLPTSGPGPAIGLPQGTYSYRMTSADIMKASGGRSSEQDAINNAGVTTWTIKDGRWGVGLQPSESTADAVYPCAGTVSVDGDVATFTRTLNPDPTGECAPYSWTARFAVKKGVVHWSAVSVPDFGWVFAAKPWRRIRN